jgi:hypothetical protein
VVGTRGQSAEAAVTAELDAYLVAQQQHQQQQTHQWSCRSLANHLPCHLIIWGDDVTRMSCRAVPQINKQDQQRQTENTMCSFTAAAARADNSGGSSSSNKSHLAHEGTDRRSVPRPQYLAGLSQTPSI